MSPRDILVLGWAMPDPEPAWLFWAVTYEWSIQTRPSIFERADTGSGR